MFGLKLGIDFTGGSLLEITVRNDVATNVAEIQSMLTAGEEKVLDSVQAQSTGTQGFLLRFRSVTEEEHQKILTVLRTELAPESADGTAEALHEDATPSVGSIQATDGQGNPVDIQLEPVAESGTATIGEEVVAEDRFESIGPTIGKELREKSVEAMIAVLIAIILYIAWAFRKVSEPVSSWKYGITAIIALAHDVMIPVGVFAVLGRVLGVEVDILFVTALLTILGYSVNDTIVVFDRTRENLAKSRHHGDFEEIVNVSVNETVTRSINTAFTTLLVLLAVFFFGGESIKYFILTLMVGVVAGTYSSIFLASPLLVEWEHWSRRRK
ncbi:MAG: protein translocase subunit SecF [Parcubacteria group bacterium]|nr:protein translocase subunit SecF [Parcubacteria group bacterium]